MVDARGEGPGDEEAPSALAVALPRALADAVAVASAQLAILVALVPDATPTWLATSAGAAIVSGVAWLASRRAMRAKTRRVARDGDAIVLDGAVRIPVASIHAIDVYESGERTRPGVRMRWLDARDCVIAQLELSSRDEAARLLRELGLDGARPARELALLPRPFAFPVSAHRALAALGAVTFAVVAQAGLSWLSIFALPFMFVSAGAALAGRVRVGDDGFELRPALGRSRFVPFGEIASVERDRGVVEVRLTSGEVLEIAAAGARNGRWQAAHADSIASAIRRGMSLRRARAERAALAARLARGDRDERSWRDLLRDLAHEGGYRGAAVSDDALTALVGDGEADPSAREGAAIVLRERGTDRDRLRELAAHTAHPRVRVALEAIAEAELEERADAPRSGKTRR